MVSDTNVLFGQIITRTQPHLNVRIMLMIRVMVRFGVRVKDSVRVRVAFKDKVQCLLVQWKGIGGYLSVYLKM